MMQRGRRLIAAALAGSLIGCGGHPAVRAPESGPIAVAPAGKPAKPAAASRVKRPDEVAVWLHVDDPEALIATVSPADPSSHPWMSDVTSWVELVDTRQPIDAVVVIANDKAKDADYAARIPIRDVRAFKDKLGTEWKLRDDGDRVHARTKTASEDSEAADEFVCDFGSTNGPDTPICGTQQGIERTAEWLRSAPAPKPDDSARSGKDQSVMRLVAYARPVEKVLEKERDKDASPSDSDRQLYALLHDTETLSLELGRDGSGLAVALTARLRDRSSDFAKDVFEPTNGGAPEETFFRIWQDMSAAVYVSGGGAMPKWVKLIGKPSDGTSPKIAQAKTDAIAILSEAFAKPIVAGYGINADRIRGALASVRTAKDTAKATHLLERALEAYTVYRLPVDIARVEKMIRSSAAAWNGEEAEKAKAIGAGNPSATKGTPPPKPTWTVRAAPAKLGMPKGSFFLDESKPVIEPPSFGTALMGAPGAKKAAAPATPPKPDVESTLFVADGQGTWAASGPDDASCAATMKKLLAKTTPKVEDEALFKRRGLVAAGYLSSIVGAFAMHRVTLSLSSLGMGSGVSGALTEIEHDLAMPRQPLPFVLTAERRGEGGVATFEIRGERDAFKVLGEHLSTSLAGGFAMLLMLGLMAGARP